MGYFLRDRCGLYHLSLDRSHNCLLELVKLNQLVEPGQGRGFEEGLHQLEHSFLHVHLKVTQQQGSALLQKQVLPGIHSPLLQLDKAFNVISIQ